MERGKKRKPAEPPLFLLCLGVHGDVSKQPDMPTAMPPHHDGIRKSSQCTANEGSRFSDKYLPKGGRLKIRNATKERMDTESIRVWRRKDVGLEGKARACHGFS